MKGKLIEAGFGFQVVCVEGKFHAKVMSSTKASLRPCLCGTGLEVSVPRVWDRFFSNLEANDPAEEYDLQWEKDTGWQGRKCEAPKTLVSR